MTNKISKIKVSKIIEDWFESALDELTEHGPIKVKEKSVRLLISMHNQKIRALLDRGYCINHINSQLVKIGLELPAYLISNLLDSTDRSGKRINKLKSSIMNK